MSDEIECLEPEALAKWLRDKGLDEATTQKLEENMVDGNMFMNLNDGDLKDLFDAFIVRKKIRDIQMQQRELKEEEITPPKAKKMKYEQLPALPTLSEPSSSKKVAPINRALSLQPKSFDENSFNTVPIPNCAVLANPKEHSEKEVDNARVRIIRLTMDSLITKCADRPTELELIHLAKSIATQYSILRDDRGLPVRDNYVMHVKTSTSCCLCIYDLEKIIEQDGCNCLLRGVKKFLERRMYNVTPARTNRGRKKTKTVETTVITTVHVHETQSAEEKKSSEEPKEKEQENQSFVQSSGEEKSSKEPKETVDRNQQTEAKKNSEKLTGEKTENISTKSVQKQNPSTSEKKNLQIVEKTAQQCSNTEKEIPDRGAEALDLELRKCASTTADHKVKQLLKVTLDLRNSLAIEIPKNSRVEEMLSKYPVFKGPKPLIANLMLNLAGNLKEEELAENVHQCSQVILDLLFAKDLCTFSRSALKTEAQQIMVAFSNLPLVFKKEGAKVPQIVHIVKRDEAFKDIASKHRNLCSPWIMFQKFGGEEVISLMIRSNIVCKIKDPKTAILALMGIYYMAQLPYPAACSMALLYIQGDILKDKGHEDDLPLMKKAEEVFRNFLSEQDIFD